MTLKELKQIEARQLEILSSRSKDGDNVAAEIILKHLRAVSQDIDKWSKAKREQEEQPRPL